MSIMISEDELDRLSKRIVAMPGRVIVTGLIMCCVILDVIGLLGLEISPTGLARLSCAIRPFGEVASPLFSEELLRYAVKACSGDALEPMISINFLLVKFSFGMVAALAACCLVIVRPEGLAALCNALSEYARDEQLYYKERKRCAKRIAIVMCLSVLGVWLTSRAPLADFNMSLTHKLCVEDGVAMLLPATMFSALIFLVVFSVVRPR
jgi:hypothetical protein